MSAIKYKRLHSGSSGSSGGPSSDTLEDVLTNGNSNGSIPILSDDGSASIDLQDAFVSLNAVGTTNTGTLTIDPDGDQVALAFQGAIESGVVDIRDQSMTINHTVEIKIDSPQIEITQQTANRVAYIDINKNLVASDPATAAVNTFNYNNFS